MKHTLFFLLIVLLSPLLAQEDVFMNNATLDDLLNTPVTTASQNQEKLSEAPATIFVLTAAEIAARGYTQLDQLLEDLPEVEIQYKSEPIAYNWTNIRGASGNDHFLILLDGVRINAPIGEKMAITGNYNIANIERVEIVIGPGSAIWGADAYGGVVNIISKQLPQDEDENVRGRVQAAYGRFGTLNANGYAQIRKKDIGLTLTAGYNSSKEPYFPKFYPTEYTWFTDSFMTKGLLQTFEKASAIGYQPWATPSSSYYTHARLNLKSLEAGLFANGEMHSSAISTQAPYALFIANAAYGTQIRSAYAKYTYKSKNEQLTGLLQGAYTHYGLNHNSQFYNIYTDYNAAYKYSSQADLSLKAQANYMINREHLFVGGITFQNTDALAPTADLDTVYGAIPNTQQYYPGSNIAQDFYQFKQSNLGAFAQYQTIIAHTLRLTLGARFDDNSRYGSTFNPRIGLIYAPIKSAFSAKLLYGESFRAPSPLETFKHYGSFPEVGHTAEFWRLPNPDLKPEEMHIVEMNLSYRRKTIIFDVNSFFQMLNHVIEDEPFGADTFKGYYVLSVDRPSNEGKHYAYGGTARVTVLQKVGNSNLNLWASYSFIDGYSDSENYLQHIARNTFKAGAVVSYNRFQISPRLIWRGETASALTDANGDPLRVSPGFFLLNLYTSYHIWGEKEKGGTIFLNIRNLTNNRYYNVGTEPSSVYMGIVPQDPIRITGGFSFGF